MPIPETGWIFVRVCTMFLSGECKPVGSVCMRDGKGLATRFGGGPERSAALHSPTATLGSRHALLKSIFLLRLKDWKMHLPAICQSLAVQIVRLSFFRLQTGRSNFFRFETTTVTSLNLIENDLWFLTAVPVSKHPGFCPIPLSVNQQGHLRRLLAINRLMPDSHQALRQPTHTVRPAE